VEKVNSEREAAYMLDRIIVLSHGKKFLNFPIHPYLLLSDIALAVCCLYAVIFAKSFPRTSALALIAALLASLIFYKIVLELRTRFGGSASRSFLRDGLFIITPTFWFSNYLLHQPFQEACSFLGMLFPLYGCFVRIGCFLGGCCYARASNFGVRYPDSVFFPAVSPWRRYTPSPNPRRRVFPIQLLESIVQAFIFSALAILTWAGVLNPKKILPSALISYCVLRFVLDFWRTVSARPRYGFFSEAQLLSLIIGVFMVIYFMLCE
jgi:phosphatidylglycerol:prolipoprotein diacylglycerol transferase